MIAHQGFRPKSGRLHELIRVARVFPLFIHMFMTFHRVVFAASEAFGFTDASDPDDEDA